MATPDLTTQTLNAHVSRWKELLYINQTALSNDRHIPVEVLRLAKSQNAPGFVTNKTQVNWTKLQPWLATQYDSLKAEAVEAEQKKNPPQELQREKLELQKLKEQVTELRNKNRKEDKNYISRKVVVSTLEKVLKDFSTTTTRIWEFEQPVKCNGMQTDEMTKYNRQYLDTMYSAFETTLNDWRNAKDLKDTIDDSGTGITNND